MWNWIKPRHPRQVKPGPLQIYQQEYAHWSGIATSVTPAERSRAEAAAQQCYAMIGASPPPFLWCDSPLAFLEALYWTREQQPGREIWDDIRSERQGLFDILNGLFQHRLLAERREALTRLATYPAPGAEIRNALEHGPLLTALEQDLRRRLPRLSFLAPPASLTITFRAAFEMLPSYADLIKGQIYQALEPSTPPQMRNHLHHWRELAESCWCWWPCESICLLCERPAAMRLDQANRLHADRIPALHFRDGWKVYAWHGVLARADIIEKPESVTPEQIENEENLELRRIMLERFGEERFLEEAGARIVQMDSWGMLYRSETVAQEPVVMVRVKNSTPEPDGTFKIYRLRVPPWVRTAKEGLAWTFGLSEFDYEPELQT
jgi:hypothetical protein